MKAPWLLLVPCALEVWAASVGWTIGYGGTRGLIVTWLVLPVASGAAVGIWYWRRTAPGAP